MSDPPWLEDNSPGYPWWMPFLHFLLGPFTTVAGVTSDPPDPYFIVIGSLGTLWWIGVALYVFTLVLRVAP